MAEEDGWYDEMWRCNLRKIGAGWSAETRDSAITDTLALVSEPRELDSMMAIKGNLEMNESVEEEWKAGKCRWISDEDTSRRCRS